MSGEAQQQQQQQCRAPCSILKITVISSRSGPWPWRTRTRTRRSRGVALSLIVIVILQVQALHVKVHVVPVILGVDAVLPNNEVVAIVVNHSGDCRRGRSSRVKEIQKHKWWVGGVVNTVRGCRDKGGGQ
jgi:hypothetical protein